MKGEYRKRLGEPYRKLLTTRLPRTLDRRVKLTDDDKVRIRALHSDGVAIRQIAREYEGKCTRRTIQYVIRPELYEAMRERFKKRRRDGRYKPERARWREVQREHRHYKKKVLGKLIN